MHFLLRRILRSSGHIFVFQTRVWFAFWAVSAHCCLISSLTRGKSEEISPLTAKKDNILDYTRESIARSSTGWSVLSIHPLWDTLEEQGPGFHLWVWEKQECSGNKPAEGHKRDEGIRAPFVEEKAMKVGMIQHGKHLMRICSVPTKF